MCPTANSTGCFQVGKQASAHHISRIAVPALCHVREHKHVQTAHLATVTPACINRNASEYVTQATLLCVQEFLGGDEVSVRFAKELVAAVNRVNYNQANSLNALAGACRLSPGQTSCTVLWPMHAPVIPQ